VKFGINVPNFGPGTDPASLAEWVRSAGSAGFDLAMMSDHVAVTPDVAELYPPPFYDPFTTLAWLAGITERIELGTTVTVLPYRNPVLTARMAANTDQISGGRFILGVGVGWSKQEYAALGVPFGRRGAITDEYLAAIGAVVDRGCVIQRRVRVLPQHLHRSLAGPRATSPDLGRRHQHSGAAPRRYVRRRVAPQQRRTQLAPHRRAAGTTVDGCSHGTPHPRVVPTDAPATRTGSAGLGQPPSRRRKPGPGTERPRRAGKTWCRVHRSGHQPGPPCATSSKRPRTGECSRQSRATQTDSRRDHQTHRSTQGGFLSKVSSCARSG
jgi:alkanesulfonate monooxygenase SsuD/methylene tetrahydromethanopterin reductase-like flavin-dependent oxidoreductase (luciferase family)